MLTLQAILFFVMLFVHAFEAMVQFLQITPYTAILGFITGVIGLIAEKNKRKTIPIITLAVSAIYLSLFFLILYGYEFGG